MPMKDYQETHILALRGWTIRQEQTRYLAPSNLCFALASRFFYSSFAALARPVSWSRASVTQWDRWRAFKRNRVFGSVAWQHDHAA